MVFQEQSIFPWMNVRDNIAFGLKAQGLGRAERYRIAEPYIRKVGLTGLLAGWLADRILVMTALPGRIKDICDVSTIFPRPRRVEQVKRVRSTASCSGGSGASFVRKCSRPPASRWSPDEDRAAAIGRVTAVAARAVGILRSHRRDRYTLLPSPEQHLPSPMADVPADGAVSPGRAVVSAQRLDVGKNFHANKWMMFRDIALPGALPMVVTGIKLRMGVALLVIVASEQVAARSGIGYLIWTSWQVFQVEKMYVGLLVIAVVGFASAILVNYFERFVVPWKHG